MLDPAYGQSSRHPHAIYTSYRHSYRLPLLPPRQPPRVSGVGPGALRSRRYPGVRHERPQLRRVVLEGVEPSEGFPLEALVLHQRVYSQEDGAPGGDWGESDRYGQ